MADPAQEASQPKSNVTIVNGDMATGQSRMVKDQAVYHEEHTVIHQHYKPQPWERIVALVAALCWIGLVGYLVVRNEPLDPNLVVFVRILLSVFAGVLGATIPGFLNVSVKGPGVAIRAGGALALFVISYFFTPAVVS